MEHLQVPKKIQKKRLGKPWENWWNLFPTQPIQRGLPLGCPFVCFLRQESGPFLLASLFAGELKGTVGQSVAGGPAISVVDVSVPTPKSILTSKWANIYMLYYIYT
jgi:hypothetical protein